MNVAESGNGTNLPSQSLSRMSVHRSEAAVRLDTVEGPSFDPKATCGLIRGLVLVGCASAESVVRPAAARVVAALPKAAAI